MKKAIKFIIELSLQVFILGCVGFFGTFLNDVLSGNGLFGDYTEFQTDYNGRVKEVIRWGARHHWYFCTVSMLVFIQIARLIIYCVYFWDNDPQESDKLNN